MGKRQRAKRIAPNLIATSEVARRLGIDPSAIHRVRNEPGHPKPALVLRRQLLWDSTVILPYWRARLRGKHLRSKVHGTRSRYNKGCHCAKCTAANTKYIADYMARKALLARLATDLRGLAERR